MSAYVFHSVRMTYFASGNINGWHFASSRSHYRIISVCFHLASIYVPFDVVIFSHVLALHHCPLVFWTLLHCTLLLRPFYDVCVLYKFHVLQKNKKEMPLLV
uniref:Uncharacterized protein n=1 Tax=Schistocephalus solidus TaxID=70667 RepID=A0A0X3Q4D8_SCHSO